MARIIIADPEGSDAATFHGLPSASPSLALANLREMDPAQRYRTQTLSGVYLELDFAAPFAWDTVALVAHNATAAATWRLRAGATQANVQGAAASYDSGTISLWTAAGRPAGYAGVALSSLHWLSSPQTYRWLRIDVSDAANPDGYLEFGRLIVDAAWQPARNLQRPWSAGFIDPSTRTVSLAGGLLPYPIGKRRVFEIPFRHLSEADAYGALYELYRRRGNTRDVLVVRDPAATTYLHTQLIHGLMTDLRPIIQRAHNRYESRLTIEELV